MQLCPQQKEKPVSLACILPFQIQAVFGLRGRRVEVFCDASLQSPLTSKQDMASLASKTLYVMPRAEKPTPCNITSPVCHFSNLEGKLADGKSVKGTLLLENPRGSTCTVDQLVTQVSIE